VKREKGEKGNHDESAVNGEKTVDRFPVIEKISTQFRHSISKFFVTFLLQVSDFESHKEQASNFAC
jgi:hypothetical protein